MRIYEGIVESLVQTQAVIRVDPQFGTPRRAEFNAYKHIDTFREAEVRIGDRVRVEHDGAYLRVRRLGQGAPASLDAGSNPGRFIA
jgi:hypothetical protein